MPHIPVMVSEVISYLVWDYGGAYVDCTVGDGMHSRAILEKIYSSEGSVIALDRDDRALATARVNLEAFGDKVVIAKMRFSEIGSQLRMATSRLYSGFLFDLGLNSSRLLEPESGFSYLVDGCLDMRMSGEDKLTAADIINKWPEKDLADLFYQKSDEKYSRRIARALANSRKKTPISSTLQLKDIIMRAIPAPYRLKSVARCFQALRMTVNDEIDELMSGLMAAFELLVPHGRILVISYHSIEDRIVKHFFRQHRRPWWRHPKLGPPDRDE